MVIDQSIVRTCGLLILFLVCIVSAQQTRIRVQLGQRAVLRCDIRGFPGRVEVMWEDDRGQFLARGSTYTIESVTMADQKTYKCRVNEMGNGRRVAFNRLYLDVDPGGSRVGNVATIQNVAKRTERLVVGGLIFRECVVTDPSGQPWSFRWIYPDGTTRSNKLLYVTGLNLRHFGTYRCIATSGSRTLETQFTVREKSGGRRPFPAVQPGIQRVVINRISLARPLKLECSAPISGATYRWTKDGRQLSTSRVLTVQGDRGDGGVYKCEVTGYGAGGSFRGEASYNLRLLIKQAESKIALSTPPGPTHVVEAGKDKELHCELDQAQGDETARWFVSYDGSTRNTVPLLPTEHKIVPTRSVSILVLEKIQKSQSGRYECIVRRNGVEVRRDAYVVVIQEYGIEVYPPTITYELGRSRNDPEFHCQVDGLSNARDMVVWKFVPRSAPAGSAPQPLPGNVQIVKKPYIKSTSFILIKNPTMSNYGNYLCMAPDGATGRSVLIVRGEAVERGGNRLMLTIKPGRIVTVNPGETARVLCLDLFPGSVVVPDWKYRDELRSQIKVTTESRSRVLVFSRVRPDQDNTVFTCHYKNRGQTTVTIRVNPGCPRGQRRCRNGDCINSGLFCNGRRDCSDGSDESDAFCAECEPNEIQCKAYNGRSPVKKCVTVHWVCDGENDCGNGYDERDCKPTPECDGTLFQCSDGNRVPRGYHCDGENDCSDNSDELGCNPPQIVVPSGGRRPPIRRVNQGTEVRFQCEATGLSNPRIVWRYNWGFVVADHRITQRCVAQTRYISELIINSVKVSDAGIYTCEALNNNGRAFGEDYILEVNRR